MVDPYLPARVEDGGARFGSRRALRAARRSLYLPEREQEDESSDRRFLRGRGIARQRHSDEIRARGDVAHARDDLGGPRPPA
ncbi:MAG: hypothetical protein FJ033_13215 [Chloroflexi bacterium]|nr:hypothetical protein [Chloroflexota bacterium]